MEQNDGLVEMPVHPLGVDLARELERKVIGRAECPDLRGRSIGESLAPRRGGAVEKWAGGDASDHPLRPGDEADRDVDQRPHSADGHDGVRAIRWLAADLLFQGVQAPGLTDLARDHAANALTIAKQIGSVRQANRVAALRLTG